MMLGFRVAATLQLITRFSDPSRPSLSALPDTRNLLPRTPKYAVSFDTGFASDPPTIYRHFRRHK